MNDNLVFDWKDIFRMSWAAAAQVHNYREQRKAFGDVLDNASGRTPESTDRNLRDFIKLSAKLDRVMELDGIDRELKLKPHVKVINDWSRLS